MANRDYQTAIRRYTELLNESPNDPEACFRLAALTTARPGTRRLSSLHRARAIDPEDPKIYNALSAVSSEMGRHDDAIAMAEHYRRLAPGGANAYDEAIAEYERAFGLFPGVARARYHLAKAYARK